MTGNDLISSALRMLNTIAEDDTPSSTMASQALAIANDMIDAWNAESLSVFTVTPNEFALTTAQNYTLGTGGDFNMARPAAIDRMVLKVNSNPQFPLELPLKAFTDEEWASITIKSLANTYPEGFWDTDDFPLRKIYFWPVPSGTQLSVVIYAWTPLSSFATLSDDHTFPPGYARALRYNLAVELSANGFGQPTAQLMKLASDSKYTIAALNAGQKTPLMSCDRAVQSPSTVPGVSRADFLGGRF